MKKLKEYLNLKLGIGIVAIIALVELLLFWFYEPVFLQKSFERSVQRGVTHNIRQDYRTIKNIVDQATADKLDQTAWLRDLQTSCQILTDARRGRIHIWIQGQGGKTLAAGFEGSTPSLPVELPRRPEKFQTVFSGERQVAAAAPLFLPDETVATIFWQSGDTSKSRGKGHAPRRFNPRLMERLIVMLTLGLLAGAILLFLLVNRMVFRPLQSLNRSMEDFAGGNLTARASIESRDEVGRAVEKFNRMADKIEQLIDNTKELTRNLSHEFNSPLYRIQIALELLRSRLASTPDKDLQTYLESIEQAVLEMDHLVRQMLYLSNQDLQEIEQPREEVDAIALIRQKTDDYKDAMQQKEITLEQQWAVDSLIVSAIAGDIGVMISNLMSNALKFTPPKGKILITGDQSSLGIANTCNPLSEEERTQVFKSFYRSSHQDINGHGVGLAVCAKIAKAHDWRIEMLDWEGQGVEVRLSFSN